MNLDILESHARIAALRRYRRVEEKVQARTFVRGAMEDRLDSLLDNRGAAAGNLPTPLVKCFVISTLLTVISQGLQPNAADAGEEMQRQFEKLVGSGLSA